jgi:hypothetical protein
VGFRIAAAPADRPETYKAAHRRRSRLRSKQGHSDECEDAIGGLQQLWLHDRPANIAWITVDVGEHACNGSRLSGWR